MAVSRAIGLEICGVLGLDPAQVVSVSIHCRPNELTTAEVKMAVDGDKLKTVLKRYTLVELAPEKAPGQESE